MHSYHDFVIGTLVEEGLLTPEALERATAHATEHRISVPEALVAQRLVTARQLAIVRAHVCECPFVDLDQYEIEFKNARMLPRAVAEKHLAFALFNLGKTVTVGMADPLDLKGVDRLRVLLKCDIDPVLCEPGALRALIDRAYSLAGGRDDPRAAAETAGPAEAGVDAEPLVAAVNQMIAQAVEEGASDIHLGPDDNDLHLRYRIDGELHARQCPPLSAHPGLVQRIKVMANLDLTQSRRPQDGKFRFTLPGKSVDIRVSIIPTVCGENVVLRLLAANGSLRSFEEQGFSPAMIAEFEEVIGHPHGMILVTGPTGSGKTTTLYGALKRLNTPDCHVVTIEDPVEIRLPLVRQVQVNTEIGMTFAGALRSILRQDPDVILVGEIRDEETARIAVQAALTGHLVLSTLHTNDATGAVARLLDFKCPGFAINASLLCVVAQRLVKRVCPDCARPYTPDAALIRRFMGADPVATFRRGVGCASCMNVGFRGRLGVYEMLRMSPTMQLAVERSASPATLRKTALQQGMRPLWQDGLDKARLGMTTLEEVARVVAVTLETDAEDISEPFDADPPLRASA